MFCYDCPYTTKIQRKYGITTHCNLEPTNMDVTYHIEKEDKNILCPFICEGTRYPDINYDKYIDDKVAKWLSDFKEIK